MSEDAIKTTAARLAAAQIVIRGQSVGRLFVEPFKPCELVLKHLKNKLRIKFRIAHVTRLKPSILIMFDEVMIGISRKGQWVEPKRIDGCFRHSRKSGRGRRKMRQVVFQNVVPDDMFEAPAKAIQLFQGLSHRFLGNKVRHIGVLHNSCKCKNPGCRRIDLQVDRNSMHQKVGLGFIGVHFHTAIDRLLFSSL